MILHFLHHVFKYMSNQITSLAELHFLKTLTCPLDGWEDAKEGGGRVEKKMQCMQGSGLKPGTYHVLDGSPHLHAMDVASLSLPLDRLGQLHKTMRVLFRR